MNQQKDKSPLSDLELIAEFRKNRDPEVFGLLFKRYTHLVYGVCMKYLRSRDDSQDAVMQIFEKLQSDILRHEIHYFKSWLYAVARNHSLMLLRSRKGIYHKSIDEPLIEAEVVEMQSGWHPGSGPEKEELLTKLEEGIRHLNPEQRTCIELFYLSQKSYVEISSLTGYSAMQVKSYIQNGKRNLKLYIEKKLA